MSCEEEPIGRHHVLEGPKLRIKAPTVRRLIEAHYGVYGHATVELCKWTKDALDGRGSCYKVKFYNAPAGGSHRCVEMSPVGMLCDNRCIYCWRPTQEFDSFVPEELWVMEPEEVIRGVLKERERLLSGYWAHDPERVKEALAPTHWAISLSGEPTLYPKLPELVKLIKSLPHTKSVFIVTNGQHPEMLERLIKEDALPTQLYLSMNAPNKELFYEINVPILNKEDAWERWLKSLELLAAMPTRTVVRITLIRSMNYDERLIPQFAELLKRGNPHFIEVKSYMHLGYSTRRLSRNDMLTHQEVVEWAKRLRDELERAGARYAYMDDDERSRIAVLQNMDRYIDRWIVPPGFNGSS
ncbi:4-demethylwyosine synthase TYW1 [Thermoproteus tenax]|uniref:S-adenosyl-L-methionine-dependent tRNA 4-demethylwyosine synthase n=1 Tax=Thermoproteus tenax (strain ATCC 35583 / DSM 2078 / JCM 9277 / NBRC 100435 / Kra 1) TaxID=768679 RepID=G4RM44_THETK|nr:4-demethylwyosine synthase TYW1 [Thermoproteus tenax]CCC82639.1 putative Fe-S oxidoreductase [Thermoproteus tenax Kra 1]